MSGRLMQAVWDYKGKDLDCTATHILARMAWYASDRGGDIYPSIPTLCQQTKLGKTQMYEHIGKLKEKGFLVPDGPSHLKTRKYRISLAKLGIDDQFNALSSIIPPEIVEENLSTSPDSGIPDSGKILEEIPDSGKKIPDSGPNRHIKYYGKKHDPNGFKKGGKERAPSMKERKEKLDDNEIYVLEKILSFGGIFESVALTIVEQHTIGDIESVLELAKREGVRNPGKYLVRVLYKKLEVVK